MNYSTPPFPPTAAPVAGPNAIPADRSSVRLLLSVGLALAALLPTAGPAAPTITVPPVPQVVFLGDPATFRVAAAGTAPLSYQWLRNGSEIGSASTSNLTFVTASTDHNALFSVVVTNTSGAVTSSPVALTIDFGLPGPLQTNRWIEITNVWRYNVSKVDLGTAWRTSSYPDAGWASGGGLLYVTTAVLPAPKTTALPLTGGSLPATCYFRGGFTNSLPTAYSLSLVVNTVMDDGVVLYLNGAEAFRLGVTNVPVVYTNLASRNVATAAWEGPFGFPVTNLLAGTNLLAAEVHQSSPTSSDVVFGMTLDAVWQPRLRDTTAPVVTNLAPADGATVSALTQIQIQFSEPVQGVDAADLRINGVPATNVTALASHDYLFRFPQPLSGPVSCTWAAGHGITDRSSNSNAFTGSAFSYLLSFATRLALLRVSQSTDAATTNTASRAVDGAVSTYSLTANLPGSWWQGEFERPYLLERIELVNRPAPGDAELAGLTLRLYNIDDQVVFQSALSNPGPGNTLVLTLPPGTEARTLWIGLPGTQANGAGNYRVGLAEVRLLGLPNIPYSPAPIPSATNILRVWQSSDYGGFVAANAVDGNTGNFTHTADQPNSYWMADLAQVLPLSRFEIVNRSSCCDNRLTGLILRLFDGLSNSIASVPLTNPGLGGTWVYTPPAPINARWMRVGLENGQTNGGGNYYVTLAEARAFAYGTNALVLTTGGPVPVTNNLASFKPSCMLRLTDAVPPAGNANDDSYPTETKTTTRTVDGYWEVDLGATYALYGVRSIAASGIGYKLTNAIVRLYDEAHESIFSRKITGVPDAFDTDLNGPIFARYVRVGLEDKQRTDPAGGIEFYIGFREVEVFGRPTNEVGILSFSSSAIQVPAGQNVTLNWAVEDVRRVEIHPAIGSVGAFTATNGIGSLNVMVTNSTEFVLVATNAAGTFSRSVTVQVSTNVLPVRISEVVAENKYSLKDGYGGAPDWIELRNPRNTAVDITGWGLSDDPLLPMKWVFPATNIAPHGTLIVFASGSATSIDPAGNLHTNFRLEKAGGSLTLTAANGTTTVDTLGAYPEQDTDLAYGCDVEGNWTYLEPTPGAVNAAPTWVGWLRPVDWSHARGFYDVAFTLYLTNNSPGSSLLYSLDGSPPSLAYTNSLAISSTKAVRAQAVRPGYRPARIQTKTFIFVNDVITSPVMNTAITQDPAYAPRMRSGLLALPAISICVPGQPEYEEKEGSLEILWPGGGEPVQVNCGISRFGNAWTKFAKRSFRMKCRARYGEAKLSVPLFDGFDRGVLAKTSFDELDLRSGSQDMVERGFYMAGRFVEDSMLDMGSLNPHGRFVHVYINGVYWGQYDCRELLVEHFMADYLGGAAEDYVVVRGNDNVTDDFVIGAPEPPDLQLWEYTRAVRNSYQSVRASLDVSHLIDFMLLWTYGNCESEFRCCGPTLPGSGFKFWIADADGFLRTNAMGLNRTSRTGPGNLFGSLVTENNPDFKALLADRVYRHFFNEGAITPRANDLRLTARMDEIRDSLLAECARWGYRTPATWESAAVNIQSNLFPFRTDQLVGYFRAGGLYPAFDPPVFDQYGGLVTNGFQPVLSSAAGTIYYTLDGTDPRLAGGGIAPQALVWAPGAVTITGDLTLNARVRTGDGQWSALAQPRYLIATRRPPSARDLLITELNYNPAGSDDFEFVELYNASTNLLDLSGVSLSNAVRYIFPNGSALPPGGFLLVVENSAAFAARYQAPASPYYFPGLTVAGAWAGALDNAGETISLLASNGLELSSVPYQTSGDWPERADGQGSSIVFQTLPSEPATDQQVRDLVRAGRNWSSSSLYNGSPGRFDTFVKEVRINEILSHTDVGIDWLELLNTGTEPVDLSGCTLTDNMSAPAQWTFPANSVLQPGQFQLISSAQLGFAFSELGERAFLLQVSGTNTIRFLDSVDFPAMEREESIGLFQRSDGTFAFTELRASTPGAPNALPRVGPVVISEIMFTPGPDHSPYIELANITSDPVPLYDPARTTNLWTLEGLGPFAFPGGTVMPPCSTLLVCATNPAVFRAQYGLDASVPVLGPWSGVLDPDGETIKLLRPGLPEPDGTVPYYRVDYVSYRTNIPWAQTLTGMSLGRVPVEAYGADPASWQAGPVNGSPGLPAGNRAPAITFSGNPVIPQLAPLRLQFTVTDLDIPWQSVTLTPAQVPPGSSYDPAARALTWTPTAAQPPGNYPVRMIATDTAACTAGQVVLEFDIQVTGQLALTSQYNAGVGEMQLSFYALAGEAYRVEYCTDLALAEWQVLHEISVPQSTFFTVFETVSPSTNARFYRVLWLR